MFLKIVINKGQVVVLLGIITQWCVRKDFRIVLNLVGKRNVRNNCDQAFLDKRRQSNVCEEKL